MNFRRLSLCMIVKDEEERIGNCLDSIKGVVDEMIIVDTGSSDETVTICKSFGAQVFHFPWNGSFADARNFGLERATGDWILWLDADEKVDNTDVYKLRDILYSPEDLLAIHWINYYGDCPDPDKTFEIATTRLFRNHKGFKFIHKIHEMLNVNEVLTSFEDHPVIKTVPIKLYHYGYLDSVTEKKKKFERNLSMLETELSQNDFSPWVYYHIANEYYRSKQYIKAFDFTNRSIIGFLQQLKTPPSLLYRLKYLILITTGNVDGAWPSIERAISLYPDYVDLHFYKGLILYAKEWYKEALEAFEHCIEMGEMNLQHLTLKGVGSFQALYYKGCCLERLGKIETAAKSFAQAASLSPTFVPALDTLHKLLAKHQNIFGELPEDRDNKTLIERALSIDNAFQD